MKRFISLIMVIAMLSTCVTLFSSCGNKSPNYASIVVEDYGEIIVELYPNIAPETVANFKSLVNEEFYDGLTFHRVMSGFMIQGGDPKGDGTGGSSKKIKGEFTNNGFNNSLSHERGVISMARSASPYESYITPGTLSMYSAEIQASVKSGYNSASCQFFIVHEDSDFLDGNYAAFGKVVKGIEVVDAIAAVEVGGDSGTMPVETVTITSIRLIESPDLS